MAFTKGCVSVATGRLKITTRSRKGVMDTLIPAYTIATTSMSNEGNHTVASNNGTVSYEKTPVAAFTIESHIDSMSTDRQRSKLTREKAVTSFLKPLMQWHQYGAERRLTVLV